MDPLQKPDFGAINRESFRYTTHLKRLLNITFEIKLFDSWGYNLNPGNFSGCLGAVIRKDAEVCISPVNLREDRYRYIDFLYTTRLAQASFSFLQPSTFGSVKSLTEPLSSEVWLYFCLLTVLFIITYRLLSKFDTSSDINSWGAIIVYSIGAIAQQGFEDTVKSASGRMLNITLLLMSFIVFTYYNASVLNSLLSPSPNTVLTTKQLLDSGMEFGLLDLPYSKERTANESIFGIEDAERTEIYKRFDAVPRLYYNMNEAIEKIRRGSFAVYSIPESFYPRMMATYTDAQICSFYNILRMPPFPLAITGRHGSPYSDMIKEALFLMSERGIVDRNFKEWYISKPRCQWRQDATSIGPKSLSVAYIVLLSGIFVSIILLLSELFKSKFFCRKDTCLNNSKVRVKHIRTVSATLPPVTKQFIH